MKLETVNGRWKRHTYLIIRMKKTKNYTGLIIAVSIILPLAIAGLFFVELKGGNFWFLPACNATLNGTTFFVLIAAVREIKRGDREKHKKLMLTAIGLSVLFLISYVTYHATMPTVKYPGDSLLRNVYLFVLASHILLSMVVVPLVLISLSRGLSEKFDKHKKIARIAFPIWLYVTFTGVVVYFMISPFYPHH